MPNNLLPELSVAGWYDELELNSWFSRDFYPDSSTLSGSAAITLAAIISAANASERLSGSSTATVSFVVSSVSLSQTITVTHGPTLLPVVSQITVNEAIGGSFAQTLSAVISNATLTLAGAPVSGTVAVLINDIIDSSTAYQSFVNVSSSTVDDIISSSTGTQTIPIVSSPVLELICNSAGSILIGGSSVSSLTLSSDVNLNVNFVLNNGAPNLPNVTVSGAMVVKHSKDATIIRIPYDSRTTTIEVPGNRTTIIKRDPRVIRVPQKPTT